MKVKTIISSMFFLSVLLLFCNDVLSKDWTSKQLTSEWGWFEDYAFLNATYILHCQKKCSCEYGSGLKVFGKPRGSTDSFKGVIEIAVYGLGALHIRSLDKDKVCFAKVFLKAKELIPIIDQTF